MKAKFLIGIIVVILLTASGFTIQEHKTKTPRIGPMIIGEGERTDGWIFDKGRNVYVPKEETDPTFIDEETGYKCVCYCKRGEEEIEKNHFHR